MADIIQLRRDTAANWTSVNPILAQGEMGVETDTSTAKVGDGSTDWISLPYIADTSPFIPIASIGVTVQAFDANNALVSDVTYESLSANGDIGLAAGQVPPGDHGHTGMLVSGDIGVTVQGYSATNALTSDVTFETLDANADVGTGATQVAAGDHLHTGVYEPADGTIVKDADIGVTVQGYSAANALTTDVTYETLDANGDVGTGVGQVAIGNHLHTGVYEPADGTILKDADIGVTVEAYDAANAKLDTVQSWTADQSLDSTGSLKLPAGTVAQRPGVPASGMLRYNSDTGEFEGYTSEWGAIAGAAAGGAVASKPIVELTESATADQIVDTRVNSTGALKYSFFGDDSRKFLTQETNGDVTLKRFFSGHNDIFGTYTETLATVTNAELLTLAGSVSVGASYGPRVRRTSTPIGIQDDTNGCFVFRAWDNGNATYDYVFAHYQSDLTAPVVIESGLAATLAVAVTSTSAFSPKYVFPDGGILFADGTIRMPVDNYTAVTYTIPNFEVAPVHATNSQFSATNRVLHKVSDTVYIGFGDRQLNPTTLVKYTYAAGVLTPQQSYDAAADQIDYTTINPIMAYYAAKGWIDGDLATAGGGNTGFFVPLANGNFALTLYLDVELPAILRGTFFRVGGTVFAEYDTDFNFIKTIAFNQGGDLGLTYYYCNATFMGHLAGTDNTYLTFAKPEATANLAHPGFGVAGHMDWSDYLLAGGTTGVDQLTYDSLTHAMNWSIGNNITLMPFVLKSFEDNTYWHMVVTDWATSGNGSAAWTRQQIDVATGALIGPVYTYTKLQGVASTVGDADVVHGGLKLYRPSAGGGISNWVTDPDLGVTSWRYKNYTWDDSYYLAAVDITDGDLRTAGTDITLLSKVDPQAWATDTNTEVAWDYAAFGAGYAFSLRNVEAPATVNQTGPMVLEKFEAVDSASVAPLVDTGNSLTGFSSFGGVSNDYNYGQLAYDVASNSVFVYQKYGNWTNLQGDPLRLANWQVSNFQNEIAAGFSYWNTDTNKQVIWDGSVWSDVTPDVAAVVAETAPDVVRDIAGAKEIAAATFKITVESEGWVPPDDKLPINGPFNSNYDHFGWDLREPNGSSDYFIFNFDAIAGNTEHVGIIDSHTGEVVNTFPAQLYSSYGSSVTKWGYATTNSFTEGQFYATDGTNLGTITTPQIISNSAMAVDETTVHIIYRTGSSAPFIHREYLRSDMTTVVTETNLGLEGTGWTSGYCHIDIESRMLYAISGGADISFSNAGAIWSAPMGAASSTLVWTGPVANFQPTFQGGIFFDTQSGYAYFDCRVDGNTGVPPYIGKVNLNTGVLEGTKTHYNNNTNEQFRNLAVYNDIITYTSANLYGLCVLDARNLNADSPEVIVPIEVWSTETNFEYFHRYGNTVLAPVAVGGQDKYIRVSFERTTASFDNAIGPHIPRVRTIGRDLLTTPVNLVYNTTTSLPEFYDGTAWAPLHRKGEILKSANYTTAEVAALLGMTAGDMVFDTDLAQPQVYNGAAWKSLHQVGDIVKTPVYTTIALAAVVGMTAGDLAFDSDLAKLHVYDGVAWVALH